MGAMITHYQNLVTFQRERFNPVVFAGNERVKMLVVSLEAGQFIPVHSPPVDLTLAVLEGEGILVAGDREERISPGTLAFVPAGEARGVRAEKPLVLLHTVTPPPTEADHAEVMAKMQRGAWK